MSQPEKQAVPESEEIQRPADEAASESEAEDSSQHQAVDAQVPEFQDLEKTKGGNGNLSLNRFYDVKVTVSAELGRVTLPISELLSLDEGSVIELNRSINSPVEIMAQGVLLAKGKVVVVDDCFAIRINEIEKDAGNQMKD